MMSVDPKITFWIGLVACIASVAADPALWKSALPDQWIPIIAAWNNIATKLGLAVMTFLTGVSSSNKGPLAK